MVDLAAQYAGIRKEIEREVLGVLAGTHYILGPQGEALEKEVAAKLGCAAAVGVASGTDALHLALRAAGIGPGDEVVTTPFTFIATAEAIAYVGAAPVFVDIDPRTFNLDPALAEQAVTPRTRAVLPVHLFGQPCEMDRLTDLCRRKKLLLIEDCCQSFGADFSGKMTGTFGLAGCFSFFPSKNLGGAGDGGMITTNDPTFAERLRTLRNHGSRVRYHHHEIGYNSRLDELQAAILRVKLRRIGAYTEGRRNAARAYTRLLAGSGMATPHEAPNRTHVFHQYTLRTDRRDDVQSALNAAGIASAVYYPIPLHRQEVFAGDLSSLSLPHAESAAAQVLSLPMFPELTGEQVTRVCRAVTEAVSG